MLRTNKPLIPNMLLLAATCAYMSSCVDNDYDLKNIDKTSQFTVNNLTVPVNLSEIKLENVIKLDDNENISVIDNHYAISKGGDIETSEFDLGHIHVASPTINPSVISVNVPELPPISGIEIPFPETKLPDVPLQTYDLELVNGDESLKKLNDIKTERPIEVEVTLSVPSSIIAKGNTITFKNIQIQLPWGLMTEDAGYNSTTGKYVLNEISVNADGKATLKVEAYGIKLGERGKIEDQKLNISGDIGIESGYITGMIRDLSLPNPLVVSVDYKVSEFDLASFSGDIDYKMDEIDIAPISLSGLPDFLDSPETEIRIANPQILISINNPVGQYGLTGTGNINLTSHFKGGKDVEHTSGEFNISGSHSDIAFCTSKEGYELVDFSGLRDILTSGVKEIGGLPESISVNIQNITFAGTVENFPIGKIGKADGSYDFVAPLGFAKDSKVIYETTVDGWGSDTLDDVNINKIHLKANCSTNLPVGVELRVQPIDKNGNEIPVKENSSRFSVDPKCTNSPVELLIESANGPIHNLDGVKFKAFVSQDNENNTEALGPDLFIKLDNIRVTVDGYYETDFE